MSPRKRPPNDENAPSWAPGTPGLSNPLFQLRPHFEHPEFLRIAQWLYTDAQGEWKSVNLEPMASPTYGMRLHPRIMQLHTSRGKEEALDWIGITRWVERAWSIHLVDEGIL